MARPTLSICIPTYQRPHLLAPLLHWLDQPNFLPFDFEVLVVNNASPEGMYDEIEAFRPKHYHFDYRRNERNIGAFNNFFGAMRRARGVLSVYVADDDRLEPEALLDAVQMMLEVPEIVATQCVWQDVDLFNGITTPPKIPFNDTIISALNADDLAQSYMLTRMMPEIGVYRTDVLGQCLWPTEIFYWAFVFVERLLRYGAIRMMSQPFYSSITRHPDEVTPRDTVGSKFDLDTWEKVARSHEFLVMRYSGDAAQPVPSTLPDKLAKARNCFFDRAMVGHLGTDDYLAAYELNWLLEIRRTATILIPPENVKEMKRRAGLTALAQVVEWTPEIRTLGLLGFDAETAAGLAGVLRGELSDAVSVVAVEPGDLRDMALLVASDQERVDLIERGAVPGLVHSLQTLAQIFS